MSDTEMAARLALFVTWVRLNLWVDAAAPIVARTFWAYMTVGVPSDEPTPAHE